MTEMRKYASVEIRSWGGVAALRFTETSGLEVASATRADVIASESRIIGDLLCAVGKFYKNHAE